MTIYSDNTPLKYNTPKFIYEFEVLTIQGNSFSEDCLEIWQDFLRDFKNRISVWDSITIHFRFNIYNTLTTRYISNTIETCNNMAKIKPVNIYWYYPEKDEDMMEAGQDYKELYTNIKNFTLISTK